MLKLSFFTLFFLLNVCSYAFDPSVGDISIESENLNIDIQAKKADFFDKVIVKQDNIKISTDKVNIYPKLYETYRGCNCWCSSYC